MKKYASGKFIIFFVLALVLVGHFFSRDKITHNTQPIKTTEVATNNKYEQFPPLSEILAKYPKDAPESERAAYRKYLQKLAKKTKQASITGCRLSPSVVTASSSSNLLVVNEDSTAHTILTGSNHKEIIEPYSSTALKLDFSKGYGIYTVFCDENTLPVGILYITP